jgi:hypothetical protein
MRGALSHFFVLSPAQALAAKLTLRRLSLRAPVTL